MAFDHTFDTLQDELRKVRRQLTELAESVGSTAARRSDGGRAVVRHAGHQLVTAGGRAGQVARRHPAATGFALLSLASAVVCLALISSQNSRGR